MRALAPMILAAGLAAAQAPPPGFSQPDLPGVLEGTLYLPRGESRDPRSLLVFLHASGNTDREQAEYLAGAADSAGFAVYCPRAPSRFWGDADEDRVAESAERLRKLLGTPEGRVHVGGCSIGALHALKFGLSRPDVYRTAVGMSAWWTGGKTEGRGRLSVLLITGEKDAKNPPAKAEAAADAIRDHAFLVEVRIVPGLDHGFPSQELAYVFFWLKAREGRFVPGEDLSFRWTDLEEGRRRAETERRPMLLYLYSRDDAASEVAAFLQTELFLSPDFRAAVAEAVPVRAEREGALDLMEALKLRPGPALLLLDPGGKPLLKLQEKEKKPLRRIIEQWKSAARKVRR